LTLLSGFATIREASIWTGEERPEVYRAVVGLVKDRPVKARSTVIYMRPLGRK